MNGQAEPPLVATHSWFGTLKARLMATSALVIAVSVSVTALAVLHGVEKRSEQALMDLERESAERVATLLMQRVVGLQKMLRAAAATVPPAARDDAGAAARFLAGNPSLVVPFASIHLSTAGGRLLALHDGNTISQPRLDMSSREYFRRTVASGVPVVSEALPGRLSNEPVVFFSMPVFGADGRVAAVLGATLRLTSRNLFDDLTYAGSSGSEATLTIITDSGGQIISHPQPQRVLQPIQTEPGLSEAAAQWLAQGRPIEPSGFSSHAEGRFVSLAGVPGADWMVFRATPDAQLMGGMTQARQDALLWAGSVALLGSLVTLALVTAFLGPLSRLRRRALALQDATRAIDEGWPRAEGEIGQLSHVLQKVLRERAKHEQARQQLLQQMGSVLAAAPIGIAFTRRRVFELVGAEWSALLGWADGELVGRQAREIYASEDEYQTLAPLVGAAFAAGRPYMGELQFRRRDGSQFWGRLQGRPVDAASAEAGTIWLLEDVTEHRETRERLHWAAHHDALTRLLNRRAFEERLSTWLDHAAADGQAALLVLDLDHFKAINDNAGHAAGDTVLREVAAALQAQVRGGDAAARLGGDEFALLLPDCGVDPALQLAQRLRQAIAQIGVAHEGRRLLVDASVGVVVIDAATAATPAAWLAHADAACYEAKHAGRGLVRLAGPLQTAADEGSLHPASV